MSTSIIIRRKEDLAGALEALGKRMGAFWDFEAHPLQVSWKNAVDRRSLSQNAMFWSLMEDMSVFFTKEGNPLTKDQAHDLMCYKFLGTADIVIGQTVIPQQMRGTSKLDRGEMTQFIDQIIDWCMDHGVPIRNPHDGEYMEARREQNGAT